MWADSGGGDGDGIRYSNKRRLGFFFGWEMREMYRKQVIHPKILYIFN